MIRSWSAPAILLGVAFIVGLGADTLGRVAPARLDGALILTALVLALAALEYGGVLRWPHADLALLVPPIAIFIPLLIWRDSRSLYLLNLAACLLLLALALPLGRRPLLREGILIFVARPVVAFLGTLLGALPLALAVEWRRVRDPIWRPIALAGAGVLAVSPVLVLFSILFASADPVFAALASRLFSFDVEDIAQQVIPRAFWVWLTAGFLWALAGVGGRGAVRAPRGAAVDPLVPSAGLGAVAALFALFLGVQSRWLFGGAAVVATTSNLTLSDYARRGFFELVTIAALTLPILLLATWAARRHERGERLVGRVAAIVLVLLGALLLSAVWRMALYTSEFGLTELRLYTTAFMGWLGLTLAWFAATVLRGRPARFTSGALYIGLGVLLTLNLLDPSGLIARVNVVRSERGRPLDATYLEGLGAGAALVVLNDWDRIPEGDRCRVAHRLVTLWSSPRSGEAWSYQRRELRAGGPERLWRLRELACSRPSALNYDRNSTPSATNVTSVAVPSALRTR